jgi:SAM-dependent methyltransferase
MRFWNLFLQLQTRYSYGGGASFVADEATIEKTMSFYQWLVGASGMPSREGLVIGPGGVNEILALQRAGLERVHVLTAHDGEVDRLRALGVESITHGDMHDMPIPTARFTFLYCSNVMEHSLAPYIALMEMRRVLVDGGMAYFIMPSFEGGEGGVGPYHLHCLTPDVWQELLRKTGFEQVETRLFPIITPQPEEERLGVVVGELLAKGTVREQAGCIHYVCFLVRAVTPPHPHNAVFDALVSAKG